MTAKWIPIWSVLLLFTPASLSAQATEEGPSTLEELTSAIVGLRAEIPPTARTASSLGLRREGNGVVIDKTGLILTIGYLILEAEKVTVYTREGREVAARVVGYDSDSGFGLLRADAPLGVRSLPMGDSARLAEKDPVLVVAHGGAQHVRSAIVVSRRTFAGYWEYLLERAIFVAPPQQNYAGAALIDQDFRLVGIGSLYVQDSVDKGIDLPGNMFVPVNHLKPILASLIATGQPDSPPRPWLGVNVAEQFGRVIVTRTSTDGPASKSGMNVGDIILEVSGKKVGTLESFYKQLWQVGEPGAAVPLKLLQGNKIVLKSVTSSNRYRHYRPAVRQ